jgi:hypothetical protein
MGGSERREVSEVMEVVRFGSLGRSEGLGG